MHIDATLSVGALLAVLVGFILFMRHRRRRKMLDPDRNVPRCRCGYPLRNLEVPRCPECGVLIGFDNLKVEDLGMTEAELLAYAKKRRGANPPSQTH